MKLDHTSKRIITNIVARQHCADSLENVTAAVFKKIKGHCDKETEKAIKEFIKDTHQRNFILMAAVMSGKI